jgi:hypothetical protein
MGDLAFAVVGLVVAAGVVAVGNRMKPGTPRSMVRAAGFVVGALSVVVLVSAFITTRP